MNFTFKIFLFFFILVHVSIHGQSCTDNELSKDFVFKLEIFSKSQNSLGACEIKINIIDKKTGRLLQELKLESESILIDESFKDCNSNKSFSTGKNLNQKPIDNDFGDLIVADFNFDDVEDFAIKIEEGGNGGPFYFFYLQDNHRKFIFNDFLSNEMMYFPIQINKTKKILTTLQRLNSFDTQKEYFQFSSKTDRWIKMNESDVKF